MHSNGQCPPEDTALALRCSEQGTCLDLTICDEALTVSCQEYRDPNRAYSDLAQTLERFPTISPRTDVYSTLHTPCSPEEYVYILIEEAFENGSSALLLHLVGTLPVSFRNMTYRFPVELWIPHTYPYEAPIAYVTPTSDMLVRPDRHVSGEGRVYHPYLAHWAEAWDVGVIEENMDKAEIY
jgi:ESCRT-I complex subunit TSG101